MEDEGSFGCHDRWSRRAPGDGEDSGNGNVNGNRSGRWPLLPRIARCRHGLLLRWEIGKRRGWSSHLENGDCRMMCLQNIEHACALHIPASRSEKHGRSAVRIPTFLWSALTSARGQPKTRAGIACLDSAELVALLEVPLSFSETRKSVRFAGVPY